MEELHGLVFHIHAGVAGKKWSQCFIWLWFLHNHYIGRTRTSAPHQTILIASIVDRSHRYAMLRLLFFGSERFHDMCFVGVGSALRRPAFVLAGLLLLD